MAYFSEFISTVPVGTIISLAHDQTPSSGFAQCNGAIIDVSSSPAFTRLFDKIGALYVKTWADGESITEGELRKSISDGTVYIATSSGTTDGTDITDDSGVTWAAAPTKFQLPDLRGEFLRGYDDGRGVDANRTLGIDGWQEDAIRNITGKFYPVDDGTKYYTGAFYYAGGYNYDAQSSGGSGRRIGFDASRVVPTAADNRPRNLATVFYIKY